MAKKQKYYVVWKGVNPGVYDSWTDCQLQIKGYDGAQYKSFETKEEAEHALASSAFHYIGKNAVKKEDTPNTKEGDEDKKEEPSIAVLKEATEDRPTVYVAKAKRGSRAPAATVKKDQSASSSKKVLDNKKEETARNEQFQDKYE